MTTLRTEIRRAINGVEGRASNVIQHHPEGGNRWSGKIANQKWVSEWRDCFDEHGEGARIHCEIRFDDECKNGHETFSIVGEIRVKSRDYMSGCIHGEIAKYFPELEPLVKWHLTSSDGPMHYVANAVYHASDLDLNGFRKGEPCSFEEIIYVANSPVPYAVKGDLKKFIKSNLELESYNLKTVFHHEKPELYGSKITLEGLDHAWYQCPFENETQAKGWCEALILRQVRIEKIATELSLGKERDLASARKAAVWPEATDEQLRLPKDELTALLKARLPALQNEFKTVIVNAGFLWSAEDEK